MNVASWKEAMMASSSMGKADVAPIMLPPVKWTVVSLLDVHKVRSVGLITIAVVA